MNRKIVDIFLDKLGIESTAKKEERLKSHYINEFLEKELQNQKTGHPNVIIFDTEDTTYQVKITFE